MKITLLPLTILAMGCGLFGKLQADTQSLGPASGLIEKGTYGPWQHDPTAPPPKHAYSPFDPRFQKPEERPLVEGVDYDKEQLVIKFKPEARPAAGAFAPRGAYRGGKAFTDLGIHDLKPVFPDSAGDWAGKPGPDGRPYPDLTLWFSAKWNQQADIKEAVEMLKADPAVAYAEPTILRKLAVEQSTLDVVPPEQAESDSPFRPRGLPSSTSDPLYDQSWHLDFIGVQDGWKYLEDQGLPPGGSRDIVVAVIDTGVDYNHPDLVANMWINSGEIPGNGQDDDNNGFVDDIHGVAVVSDSRFESGDPNDDHGHGTHVAGIIAMQANNGIGGTGVAYNAQIMAIKAAQYSGILSAIDISQAIYYAIEKGADVINMSYGGYNKSQIEEDALAVAFGQAVLVAAAGNDRIVNDPACLGKPMYPAAHNWIIGVMAGTTSGGLAGFSNTECIPHNRFEYEIILPGVDIMSTLPGDQYAAWDGTSMAAPVASGMAVLLRSKWADKDVYSSRFIMGQLVANNGNLLAAMTKAPEPELRYLEHWLFDREQEAAGNDGDGIVDNGETVELAIVIRNHWGKAGNVTLKLEAQAEAAFQPDPYVTFEIDEVNLGAVGSFNWDDNGLIYDDEGLITGVRTPLRFSVASNTPNDHLIPFKLTMTCENGYEPDDPNAPYVFESRFTLVVQNGRTLVGPIKEDLTLTKDFFWIIPDAALVNPGVTVNIEPGTQIQFGSSNPNDVYNDGASPKLQIEGKLYAQGSIDDPIEVFPGLFHHNVWIYTKRVWSMDETNDLNGLFTNFSYVNFLDFQSYEGNMADQNEWYRCRFYLDKQTWGVEGGRINDITECIFRGRHGLYRGQNILRNLFEENMGWTKFGGNSTVDNVYLTSKIYYPQSAGMGTFQSNDSLKLYYSNSNEGAFVGNSFLNPYWNPNLEAWQRLSMQNTSRSNSRDISQNYFGTTSLPLIEALIHDYNDDFNLGEASYVPILEIPSETAWPHVWDFEITDSNGNAVTQVGLGSAQFRFFFNRDMDTSIAPQVSFGPDTPMTDYTIHPIDGGWANAREWVGQFNINPITGDGYQLIRVAKAVAADDPWFVSGIDSGRMRFEIITSGAEALTLQSTGGEGFIDLSWVQDDFDLMAGFNLYRSQSAEGNFQRINQNLLSPTTKDFRDTNVAPGETYYYKFTVVKTDFTESDYSNVSESTPLDTIPPNISHSELHSASPGLPVTLTADATDNVQVVSVKLYYRAIGDSEFRVAPMTRTVNNRYAATLEGSKLKSPGLEYYLVVSDGISNAFAGRAEFPIAIEVIDEPVVSGINPNTGPASGGTAVTLIGSNFKDGATVNFNGVAATDVVWVSANQLTCTTPAQLPLTSDVRVVNPDGGLGALLNGYKYFSTEAQISLPDTGGGRESVVRVPVAASNLQQLVSADFTIHYDAAVLKCTQVYSGELLTGWNIASNTSEQGVVRISTVSTKLPVMGSGTLFELEFSVIGSNGTSGALTLSQATLNDGAINNTVGNGTFTVDSVYDVRGQVRFWNENRPVSGVALRLEGEQNFQGESTSDGSYGINGAIAGSYDLKPAKSNETSSISPYDAALVLQHAVGLTTLSGASLTAADVNKNGTVNSTDAYHILQYSVGLTQLPFSGSGVVWDFEPQTRSVQVQQSHLTNTDFTGILIGDVSGNWPDQPASQTLSLSEANTAIASLVQVDMVARAPGLLGVMSRELNQPRLSNAPTKLAWRSIDGASENQKAFMLFAQTSAPGLVSVDAAITYPGLHTIQAGSLSDSMFLAQGNPSDDQARIGMATAAPVHGTGSLITLQSDQASLAFPTLEHIAINEGHHAVMWDQEGQWMEEDADADGHSFWQEIVAGTDPEDVHSVFQIQGSRWTDQGALEITWTSVPDKRYLIERRSMEDASAWTPVQNPTQAKHPTTAVKVSAPQLGEIYRVRVLP